LHRYRSGSQCGCDLLWRDCSCNLLWCDCRLIGDTCGYCGDWSLCCVSRIHSDITTRIVIVTIVDIWKFRSVTSWYGCLCGPTTLEGLMVGFLGRRNTVGIVHTSTMTWLGNGIINDSNGGVGSRIGGIPHNQCDQFVVWYDGTVIE
jgi:hypothetical protein